MHFNALATAALAAVVVTAHPGQDESHEVAARRDYLATTNSPRSLAHCASSIKARGLEARNVQRRAARAAALGAGGKRTTSTTPLSARDSGSVLATDHNATELGYTLATPEATLFASSANSSCILNPVVTQGPYYVAGEYVRSDIVEAQEGVPLHFEAQVLDVNTCEPVAGAFVEIWHCNSTGVYSGIVAGGNGVRTDEDNWDTTFLRGAAQTDDDGVVTFETLFPGHYLSRTNHIHTMVHLNATAQANGTLMDLSSRLPFLPFHTPLPFSSSPTPLRQSKERE